MKTEILELVKQKISYLDKYELGGYAEDDYFYPAMEKSNDGEYIKLDDIMKLINNL